MMYYVYVLASLRYPKSYVGCSDDIARRLKQHNAGKMLYTRRYKPWKIIYSEKFDSLSMARKREHYLKTGAGRRFLKTIFAN